MKNSKTKGLIGLLILLVAVVGFGFLGYKTVGDVKLGLDLAGGVSITYQAKDSNPSKEDMSDTVYKMQQRVSQYSTEAQAYQEGSNRITIEIPGVSDANAILEELGIGRPSTYAPTISTIIARRYVAKENKNLYLTEIGEVVNNIMKQSFPSIVDVNFTANMESLLDGVAEGKVRWKTIIENFYPDLEAAVEKAETELEQVKIEDEVTDVICEECGRNMVVKYGPHGKFLACPGFPDCRNTKPYLEKIGVPCPVCGKDVVIRKTKKGRRYYGCEDNLECEFMSWQKPSTKKCPRCGKYMLEKGNKLVCSDEQCGYVENIENNKDN